MERPLPILFQLWTKGWVWREIMAAALPSNHQEDLTVERQSPLSQFAVLRLYPERMSYSTSGKGHSVKLQGIQSQDTNIPRLNTETRFFKLGDSRNQAGRQAESGANLGKDRKSPAAYFPGVALEGGMLLSCTEK